MNRHSEVKEDDEEVAAADKPPPSPWVSITRFSLREEQKKDESLKKCFSAVGTPVNKTVEYLIMDDVLMRRWANPTATGAPWGITTQIVIPQKYRYKVLTLAHEGQWAGHLGIRKTYQVLLEHFFWPGMKKDVSAFCNCCHVCQLAGKPNQKPKPAPLHPIPVVGNPFDNIVVDCVGPLPRSKSGKRFLLTMMCTATRFPEAIPLTITARSVTKALTSFFSVFGLPRVLQTDQGFNFKSDLFKGLAKTLGIQHITSSTNHPESQGFLERWHQTLTSMLKKYCLSTGLSWDEGVLFLLFAAREAPQESLGYSPAQLVFGHTPRGPLKALKEQFLQIPDSNKEKVNQYIKQFRWRLKLANQVARDHLDVAQTRMKVHYDTKATSRDIQPGDQVLMLNPLGSSSLSAQFTGPHEVLSKINATTYVISTPNRRQKSRACHINMLKLLRVGVSTPPSLQHRCEIFIPGEGTHQLRSITNQRQLQILRSTAAELYLRGEGTTSHRWMISYSR
uniref:Gypsy retrotransposon integrase-like protein 1 n=1 Tax=Nothobranchius furzeri TaxID=105023 RepID=A0A8C6L2B2_NOTFU